MKQLFLYLTAEYETPNNQLNQVRAGTGSGDCYCRAGKVVTNLMVLTDLALLEHSELCGLVQPACWAGVASFVQTFLVISPISSTYY